MKAKNVEKPSPCFKKRHVTFKLKLCNFKPEQQFVKKKKN